MTGLGINADGASSKEAGREGKRGAAALATAGCYGEGREALSGCWWIGIIFLIYENMFISVELLIFAYSRGFYSAKGN